ncbi:MAG: hypothetical protein HC886_11730, partial [Leptolyngbyaceae cyanobacterium SM1_1_3]|nr:hypothetical protein [Leptolyngbyaceae cyanobacterium SM1_1_3]
MRFWLAAVLVLILALAGITSASAEAYSSPNLEQLSDEQIDTIAHLRQEAFAATQTGQFEAAADYWTQLLELLPDAAALWSNR